MGIFLPLLAGAALGGVKTLFGKGRESRDRKLAAETQRYAPWTGLEAKPVQEESLFGNLLQGGVTGAMLGQGLGEAANVAGAGGAAAGSAADTVNLLNADAGIGVLQKPGNFLEELLKKQGQFSFLTGGQ
jgi:hypothetical protein